MIRTNIVNLPTILLTEEKSSGVWRGWSKSGKGKGAPRLERDICERREIINVNKPRNIDRSTDVSLLSGQRLRPLAYELGDIFVIPIGSNQR